MSPFGFICIHAYVGLLAGIHAVPLASCDMGSLRSTEDDIDISEFGLCVVECGIAAPEGLADMSIGFLSCARQGVTAATSVAPIKGNSCFKNSSPFAISGRSSGCRLRGPMGYEGNALRPKRKCDPLWSVNLYGRSSQAW